MEGNDGGQVVVSGRVGGDVVMTIKISALRMVSA